MLYNLDTYGFFTLNKNTSISQAILLAPYFSRLNIQQETQTREAKAQIAGKTVDVDYYTSGEIWTVTMNCEVIDNTTLSLALGEEWQTVATSAIPAVGWYTIGSDNKISGDDLASVLTGTTIDDVQVSLLSLTGNTIADEAPLEMIDTGLPSAGQVQLDETNNELVFTADLAGRAVGIKVIKTLTNAKTIGTEAAFKPLNDLGLIAVAQNSKSQEGFIFEFPRISKSSGFSLDIAGEGTIATEITYRCLAAGSDRSAIKVYSMQ